MLPDGRGGRVSSRPEEDLRCRGYLPAYLRGLGRVPGGKAGSVLKADFGFDPMGDIEMRKEISKLLCVWESSRMQLKCQEQNRQDAKLGVQQRLVQNTEYIQQ